MKNVLKYSILYSIAVLLIFVFTRVYAQAQFTIHSYNPPSIGFTASGFPVNTKVTFTLKELSSNPGYDTTDTTDIVTDGGGSARPTFSSISIGSQYEISGSYENNGTTTMVGKSTLTAFDLRNLTSAYNNANNLLSSAAIGTAPGQYSATSREAFIQVFNATTSYAVAPPLFKSINQADIDSKTTQLNTAMDTFQKSKIATTQNSNNNNGNGSQGSGGQPSTTPPAATKSGSSAGSSGIVPNCNKGAINTDPNTGGHYVVSCDWDAFMTLINNVINFLLFTLATPLAALAICYAGFLLLTGGGNEHKRTQAKHIIINVIVGYLIGLAAWIVVKTILVTLGFKGPMFLK
jgi:hypothetical protein